MIDFSFSDPPVEVAASRPRLEMIMSRLRGAGLRPYPAGAEPELDGPDPLFIDLESAPPEFARLGAQAPADARLRPLIVLATPDTARYSAPGALLLPREQDILTLRSRLTAEARRRARQREATIRHETVIALGADLPRPDIADMPALLYLGDCSANFLSLQKMLREQGIDLTAALSHQTARQHMTTRRFTAALADTSLTHAGTGGFARWIMREDGLRGLPLVLMAALPAELSEDQLTLLAHASAILDGSLPDSALAEAIDTECRRLHAGAPMIPLPGLALAVTDIVSGLFSRAFFEAHLPRQMTVAADQIEPLSVLVLRLDAAHARSRPAQKTAGDVILRHIRQTDCGALMQPGVFAISLPATPYRGGVRLAERINDAVARTEDAPGLSWRVTERRLYHTPPTLLAASLIGPFERPRIAA